MNTIQEERAKAIKYHIDAIKFNAKKSGNFKVICNMNNQLEKYESRIAKLSLPLKFGMYKPSKSMEKVSEDIELEDLDVLPQRREIDPDHKVRKIFP